MIVIKTFLLISRVLLIVSLYFVTTLRLVKIVIEDPFLVWKNFDLTFLIHGVLAYQNWSVETCFKVKTGVCECPPICATKWFLSRQYIW